MSESDFPLLCFDLHLATQLYPDLQQAADKQESLLQAYLQEDLFFRRNFASLFAHPDQVPSQLDTFSNDLAQKTLLRLCNWAREDDLVDRAAVQLEFNNDRAFLACLLLHKLLQRRPPEGKEEG